MKPLPFIVVPNWNGAAFLGECLESLQRQSTDCQIAVVDNASTDGSRALLAADFPAVHVVGLDRNRGFAGGVNAGIDYALEAGATHIILFNNDAVAGPGWLAELLKAAGHADIAASRIMHYDDHSLADSTGDFLTVWGVMYPRDRDTKPPAYHGYPEIFAASGGASLYTRRVFETIGRFDEAFFAYFEDGDFGARARLAGLTSVLAPQAVVYHHIGGTSGGLGHFARYHSIKNCWYLYLKNLPAPLAWRLLPRFVLVQALWFGSAIRNGALLPALHSYGTLLVNLPRVLRLRRGIQRQRVLTSPQFAELLINYWPLKSRLLQRWQRPARRDA